MAFNGNLHEPPMKNLLSPFKREELLYLYVLAFLFVFFRCSVTYLVSILFTTYRETQKHYK